MNVIQKQHPWYQEGYAYNVLFQFLKAPVAETKLLKRHDFLILLIFN